MAMPAEPKEFSRAIENLIADFRGVPEDRGRSRRRPMKELGALVEDMMVKYKIGRPSTEQTIRDHWAKLVGAANAAYSHPVVIERGRLLVLVSHSVVRNELFQHREPILEKLKKLPGCAEIRGLTLRAG